MLAKSTRSGKDTFCIIITEAYSCGQVSPDWIHHTEFVYAVSAYPYSCGRDLRGHKQRK